jgi:hypothetical protein
VSDALHLQFLVSADLLQLLGRLHLFSTRSPILESPYRSSSLSIILRLRFTGELQSKRSDLTLFCVQLCMLISVVRILSLFTGDAAHFPTEALTGLSTIHAWRAQDRYIQVMDRSIGMLTFDGF